MSKHMAKQKHRSANARNILLIRLFSGIICVSIAFAAGFFVRGDEDILSRLGFESLLSTSEQNPGMTVSGSTNSSISARLAEVEGILLSDSMNSYDLDTATDQVLTVFAEAIDDTYLRYYDESRYQAYIKESASTYGGVGGLFSGYNGTAYAVDVFEGSVADALGVEEGDFVVAIDGDRSQDWSLTEVVNALALEAGETIYVTWRRPASLDAEGGEEFTTELAVSEYEEPNVVCELDDKVGYISLTQLTQNSTSLVSEAIETLEEKGALAYVLDLRGNPGGYLTQAVEIASLFITSGVVVEIETVSGNITTKSVTGATVATDKPLVVLIDGDTSAAAEVLAAALQDSQRATLVGTVSMGKGSVQRVTKLSFGGALRYTAAYYLTSQGYDIDGVGISPDVTVNAGNSDSDTQKTFAIETAASLVEL